MVASEIFQPTSHRRSDGKNHSQWLLVQDIKFISRNYAAATSSHNNPREMLLHIQYKQRLHTRRHGRNRPPLLGWCLLLHVRTYSGRNWLIHSNLDPPSPSPSYCVCRYSNCDVQIQKTWMSLLALFSSYGTGGILRCAAKKEIIRNNGGKRFCPPPPPPPQFLPLEFAPTRKYLPIPMYEYVVQWSNGIK